MKTSFFAAATMFVGSLLFAQQARGCSVVAHADPTACNNQDGGEKLHELVCCVQVDCNQGRRNLRDRRHLDECTSCVTACIDLYGQGPHCEFICSAQCNRRELEEQQQKTPRELSGSSSDSSDDASWEALINESCASSCVSTFNNAVSPGCASGADLKIHGLNCNHDD